MTGPFKDLQRGKAAGHKMDFGMGKDQEATSRQQVMADNLSVSFKTIKELQ